MLNNQTFMSSTRPDVELEIHVPEEITLISILNHAILMLKVHKTCNTVSSTSEKLVK